ncbi:hypothetical protein EDC19_2818 [Natranaerovirga hydrolytica]|uniref:Uncharacterized protein n=1 Tax=Natranaerovirga hydrolytica TaxID=680378 RepID=A0A4R1M7E0_9FIRM|nr:hypothetical protein [Natranaerovirga hydrolytica]TCK86764.1 hypothetical protein EDC19_2818 [Natranaerovirga hydrolytica]
MKIREKINYKMSTLTYGRKKANKSPDKFIKALDEIEEVISDVVKVINTDDKEEKKDKNKQEEKA